MTGYPDSNFASFFEAEARLVDRGHDVFNPARHDVEQGFDPRGRGITTREDMEAAGFNIRHAMHDDLAWITKHAEAIVVLHGWSTSAGTLAELATARAIGIPMYTFAALLRFPHDDPKPLEWLKILRLATSHEEYKLSVMPYG